MPISDAKRLCLSRFLDGELSPDERVQVNEWLDCDADARSYLAELVSVKALLVSGAGSASVQTENKTEASLKKQTKNVRILRHKQIHYLRVQRHSVVIWFVAAAASIAILSTLIIFHTSQESVSSVNIPHSNGSQPPPHPDLKNTTNEDKKIESPAIVAIDAPKTRTPTQLDNQNKNQPDYPEHSHRGEAQLATPVLDPASNPLVPIHFASIPMVSGKAHFLRGSKRLPLATGVEILPGDQIFTDKDALAEIVFNDGTHAHISEQTEVCMPTFAMNDPILLRAGTLRIQTPQSRKATSRGVSIPAIYQTIAAVSPSTEYQVQLGPSQKDLTEKQSISPLIVHVLSGQLAVNDGVNIETVREHQSIQRWCRKLKNSGATTVKTVFMNWDNSEGIRPEVFVDNGGASVVRTFSLIKDATLDSGERLAATDLADQIRVLLKSSSRKYDAQIEEVLKNMNDRKNDSMMSNSRISINNLKMDEGLLSIFVGCPVHIDKRYLGQNLTLKLENVTPEELMKQVAQALGCQLKKDPNGYSLNP